MSDDDWDFDAGCEEQGLLDELLQEEDSAGPWHAPPDEEGCEQRPQGLTASTPQPRTTEQPGPNVEPPRRAEEQSPQPSLPDSTQTPPRQSVLPLVDQTPPDPKKRRVRGKSPAEGAWKDDTPGVRATPEAQGGPCWMGELTADHDIPADRITWWARKSHGEKYDYVYNKLRRNRVYESFQAVEDLRQHRKSSWPESWTELTAPQKKRLMEYWSEHADDTPSYVREWALEHMLLRGRGDGSGNAESRPLVCS